MPDFTITLSDTAVTKLQAVVAAYNQRTGQTLTVKQWLLSIVKDYAIREDLSSEIKNIQDAEEAGRQARVDAAVAARKQALLADL